MGVEPIRCCHHRILSPARLPIPSRRHMQRNYVIINRLKIQMFSSKFLNFFFKIISRAIFLSFFYYFSIILLLRFLYYSFVLLLLASMSTYRSFYKYRQRWAAFEPQNIQRRQAPSFCSRECNKAAHQASWI